MKFIHAYNKKSDAHYLYIQYIYTEEKSLQYMEQERQLHKLLRRVIADVKQPAALFMLKYGILFTYIYLYVAFK